MKRLSLLGWICEIIVVVAGLDWGLVALFKFDLVNKIFGSGDIVRIVHIVVGVAAVVLLIDLVTGKTRRA
jgi:uncharacterized membrane protein YuzA (DUF378 family)